MADTESLSEVVSVDLKIDDTKMESKEDVAFNAKPVIVSTKKVSKELQAQIVKQVEYYFGNVNLATDKFLCEEIKKDNGWITLELLLKFKRMKALTSDTEVVCAALDTSNEGLIEINQDRLKLRRHPERPLPEPNEETRKECITRTAYVKGFPLKTAMSELIEFFNNHEKVVNIVRLKYLDKPTKEYKFQGSVFATFLKRDQCEEFLKKEDEFKGFKLERMWQNDPARKINFPKGALLHCDGFSDKITQQLIKEAVAKLDVEVAFVDYRNGNKKGYIRLTEENSAKSFVDKLENNKLKIGDDEVDCRLVEGDEEMEYLAKQVQQMTRGGNFNSLHKGRCGHNRRKSRKRSAPEETWD